MYPPYVPIPPPPPRRRSWLGLLVRILGGVVIGAVVLGALGFFVVDDLGMHSRVNTLSGQLSLGRSTHQNDTQTIAGLQSQQAADDQTNAVLQSQLAADQEQITSLQAQLPTMPQFTLVDSGWDAPCSNDSCFPEASFINHGQSGGAVAIFQIYAGSSTNGAWLAECSAALPVTPANGAADARCTESSAELTQYFDNNPTGEVTLAVSVQNP